MRDPEAGLHIGESVILRHLRHPLHQRHFLMSSLARRWADDARMVQFEVLDEARVQAAKLPFVSQPTEWCDAQLHDAARLTLDLQREAVEQQFDMKDASAWNVLYDGARPVFCDLMSFVPLVERKWWAAGQFARHFILPLAVGCVRGLQARKGFQISRDGMSPQDARSLLGMRRFFTRFWPAMAGREQAFDTAAAPANAASLPEPQSDAIVRYRRGLHETFSWMLNGARPVQAPASNWAGYREHRAHYPEGSVEVKRATIHAWLTRTAPGWVLDLGCNTGEFSCLAAGAGARVVAIDGDHDAVQSLYLSLGDERAIHPLVASLDDLSGGRGWNGREHPGLPDRIEGRFDMVLMLALVHHLFVSSSIPLGEVAAFVWRCTRCWAAVEWIDETDSQMRLLCSQRHRDPRDFSIAAQRQAFADAGFVVEEEVQLTPGSRRLALLRRVA